MIMRALICFNMLLAALSITLAKDTVIQLAGPHDRVLITVPENWNSYGEVGAQALAGISLTPKPPAVEVAKNYPTVSIRVDVESPGSCGASDKLVKSELTKFDQRKVSTSESVVLRGKRIAIIHTRNDEADYLHVCVTLNRDRILFTLTVSSGSDPKFLRRYKREFIWVLEHVDAVAK